MPKAEGFQLFARARAFGDRTAILEPTASVSYAGLLGRAATLGARLLDGRSDLAGARVMLLSRPGAGFVTALWAIWHSGGVAVPISLQQAPADWADLCADAQAAAALVDADALAAFRTAVDTGGMHVVALDNDGLPESPSAATPASGLDRPALMLYTSGTTSRPKGVVITFGNIQAQVESLVQAWDWHASDRIPLVLPLNHVHGLTNVVTCALWSGAVCEMGDDTSPASVWNRLSSGDVTVFMAVPTIYHRLIAAWDGAPRDVRARWSAGAARLRLMVSGSAALPPTTLERWRQITGHELLERYGMTEIGMALSNPLHGERRAGSVGVPLPGVDVRVLDEEGVDVEPGVPGEIHVRGDTVFREYWGHADATRDAFRPGGWFRTGDVAVVEDGRYRILGRLSVDIIKTGGEKVSALEIEGVLRQHPDIADCAIVGIPDVEWGECVCAAVILAGEARLDLSSLREWARPRLAPAKRPRRLSIVSDLPRNAMGKVSKAAVKRFFDA